MDAHDPRMQENASNAHVSPEAPGAPPPRRVGLRPHLPALVVLAALAASVGACGGADGQVTTPTVVGMDDQMASYYSDGQMTIYQVQTPVQWADGKDGLRMRRPNADEKAKLGKAAPYPREPWIKVDDVKVTIRYTITNLDDKKHSVELLVDPWNEFVRYQPGIQIISDEETLPDLSGYDKFFVLQPKSRTEGTLTPDDTHELAVDLATVMNINANPPANANDPNGTSGNALFNHVFNLQNRSNGYDPLITPYIPAVVPAITGFDLGLRSYEPMNVAVEVSVDVQDLVGNKVVPLDGTDPMYGIPGTVLAPPKAPAQ